MLRLPRPAVPSLLVDSTDSILGITLFEMFWLLRLGTLRPANDGYLSFEDITFSHEHTLRPQEQQTPMVVKQIPEHISAPHPCIPCARWATTLRLLGGGIDLARGSCNSGCSAGKKTPPAVRGRSGGCGCSGEGWGPGVPCRRRTCFVLAGKKTRRSRADPLSAAIAVTLGAAIVPSK